MIYFDPRAKGIVIKLHVIVTLQIHRFLHGSLIISNQSSCKQAKPVRLQLAGYLLTLRVCCCTARPYRSTALRNYR